MPKKPANPVGKSIKKAIKQYYDALQSYRDQGVKHEGALETAFQRLLGDAAKVHHCTLIPKQKIRINKNNLFPDGTVRDIFARRGFWEAKDTDDDLDKEIAAKIAKGYPLNNTIFEDTREAVLFQSGQQRYRFDLTKEEDLASLLTEFFAYTEPEIENFQQAVEEFKDRVPELAKGLVGKLDEAHKSNNKFKAAFEGFLTVCQQTLNPNISRAAVDEMLVQHLLTERLIRKIFDNPEFMHRNVIAVEIEKVIDALVDRLSRREHPRPLHRHRQLHRQPDRPHPQEGPAARLQGATLRQRGHAAAEFLSLTEPLLTRFRLLFQPIGAINSVRNLRKKCTFRILIRCSVKC
jgi:hypothetical protein